MLLVCSLSGFHESEVAEVCRQHLRERFPTKLWLDVLSKADLLEEEFDAADVLAASGNARLRDWDPSAVEQHSVPSDTANVITGTERAAADDVPLEGSGLVTERHAAVSLPAVQQAGSDSPSVTGSSGSGRVYRWGDGSGSADVDGRQLAGASGAVDAAQVVSLPVSYFPHAGGCAAAVAATVSAATVLDTLQSPVSSLPSRHAYPRSHTTCRDIARMRPGAP